MEPEAPSPAPAQKDTAVTRRALLIGGAIGLGGGLVAAQLGPLIGTLTAPEPPGPGQQMINALRTQFPYLTFDDAVAGEFVVEYAKTFGPPTNMGHYMTTFLLSTDFLPDGDESRPLSFIALYSPRTNPCLNPLARTD